MSFNNMFGSDSWRKLRELKRPQPAPLGGVCLALGEATPLAAWMWRVLFILITLAWGAGVVAYIILWVAIPEQTKDAP